MTVVGVSPIVGSSSRGWGWRPIGRGAITVSSVPRSALARSAAENPSRIVRHERVSVMASMSSGWFAQWCTASSRRIIRASMVIGELLVCARTSRGGNAKPEFSVAGAASAVVDSAFERVTLFGALAREIVPHHRFLWLHGKGGGSGTHRDLRRALDAQAGEAPRRLTDGLRAGDGDAAGVA